MASQSPPQGKIINIASMWGTMAGSTMAGSNGSSKAAAATRSATWQEYLAPHLGEPIANFGMGGHGVYQAYRRMLREEKTRHAAHHFFAFSIKDRIVEWLNPKPIPYQQPDVQIISFKGYLQGC